MEKDLSFLTEKQKIAYTLKTKGMKYKEIAELMHVSYNMARQHYLNDERRIREYENYISIQEKNLLPVTIDINLGELKLIIRALMDLTMSMTNKIHYNVKSNWFEKLPYEYTVAEELLKHLHEIRRNAVNN